MPFSLRFRPRRALLIVVTGALLLAAYALWYLNTPVRVAGFPVEFEIAPGSGLRGAVRTLEKAGSRHYEIPMDDETSVDS